MEAPLHVVTGAFGYSGRWIAKRLLDEGVRVRTLTNAVGRDDPFDGAVEVHAIDFEDHHALVDSLRGATEIPGLRRGLMASDAPVLGRRRFTEWVAEVGPTLGRRYQNDLHERRYRRPQASSSSEIA